MKPLHQLVVQHKQLEQLDPEDVDEETLMNTLEGLEGEIEIKATSIAAVVRNIECFAEAVSEAAKKMNSRAAKLNKRADSVRAYLMAQMKALGQDKIETPAFTLKIKKNPIAVIIEDIDKIPAKYKTYPDPVPTINKAAIKNDIEKGDEVPGARTEQATRLEIKE